MTDYILRPANRPSCVSCMDEYASVIQRMNGRAIWLRSILGMTTKTKLIVWHKTHKQWQRMSEVLARGLCINTVTHNAECWNTGSMVVTVDRNSIKRESTESRRQYSVSLRNESTTYNTSENKPARVENDRHQTNIPHATHGTCTANVIRTSWLWLRKLLSVLGTNWSDDLRWQLGRPKHITGQKNIHWGSNTAQMSLGWPGKKYKT